MRIGLVVLLVLATLQGCATELPQDLPVPAAEPIVMADVPMDHDRMVRVFSSKGDCSGVVVGPELVATAEHCIADKLRVEALLATVVRSDRELDLALLHAPGLSRPAVSIAPEVPAYASEIFVLGYGCEGRRLQARAGAFSSVVDRWLELRVVACQGDSGGAAIDAEGRLIGILVESDLDQWTYAVPAATLDEWAL